MPFKTTLARFDPNQIPKIACINKSTLEVLSGQDLIRNVVLSSGTVNFSRFCSADLPAVSAFAFRGAKPPIAEDAWMSTIGMFDNDPIMREILEESNAIRTRQRTD